MNQREAKRQAHDLVAQMIDACLTQIVRPDLDDKVERALQDLQTYHEQRGVWETEDAAAVAAPYNKGRHTADVIGVRWAHRSTYCSCACGDAKYKHVVENGGKGPYAMPAFRCSRCSGTGIPTTLEAL